MQYGICGARRCHSPCHRTGNPAAVPGTARSALNLQNSWLGLPPTQAPQLLEQTIPCELPPGQQADSSWHWNSLYWRTLGAPWGGLITTTSDLGELLALVLRGGSTPSGTQLLSFHVIESVLSNQTQHSASLGEQDRLRRAWGYGWRFNWLDHSGCFSDLLPADCCGHWGATGTLMWVDRRSGSWGAVLTNQPWERSQPAIQRLANVLVDAGGVWRDA
ncbi:MAG: serine hydrolase [Planctomycetota bacterium]